MNYITYINLYYIEPWACYACSLLPSAPCKKKTAENIKYK